MRESLRLPPEVLRVGEACFGYPPRLKGAGDGPRVWMLRHRPGPVIPVLDDGYVPSSSFYSFVVRYVRVIQCKVHTTRL